MHGGQRLSFPSVLADKIRQTNCDFVVTGGSGWIGQATLEMLESALGDGLMSRLTVFGSSARDLKLRSGRAVPCRKLDEIVKLDKRPKLFVHCAFLTKDRLADQSTESFVAANKKISDLVATAIETSDARGLFTPSSGAVYKKGTHVLDDDLAANPYGVMKIEDEKRFVALAAKKHMPLCMPRLFNLAGPFINKLDLYALASIIKAVQAGQPVAIRAPHGVIRSYIHVQDLVSLAFAMLLDPKPSDEPIFDTAGDEVLEIGDLATKILSTLGKPDHAIDRPARVQGRDDVYVGDAAVMRRLMQAHGLTLTPMERQIRDTAEYMQSCAHV